MLLNLSTLIGAAVNVFDVLFRAHANVQQNPAADHSAFETELIAAFDAFEKARQEGESFVDSAIDAGEAAFGFGEVIPQLQANATSLQDAADRAKAGGNTNAPALQAAADRARARVDDAKAKADASAANDSRKPTWAELRAWAVQNGRGNDSDTSAWDAWRQAHPGYAYVSQSNLPDLPPG